MRKLAIYLLAGAAAASFAGVAVAADQATKTMKVALADGSTVTIEYVGDVAPKVRVDRAPALTWQSSRWAFPEFAEFDRYFAEMHRRTTEMMRRMDELRRHSLTGTQGVNLASTGNLPAGTSSVSIVAVSNGGKSCTRTTEVIAQEAGKPPKVTSQVSGDCGPETNAGPAPAQQAVPTA